MNEKAKKTIEIFKNGGVVIFPTDTAFGIGCRIDMPDSVERVYEIRKRPREKAVLALVSTIEMAQEYLEPIPSRVRSDLMEKYWPGGLTIILRCKEEEVPSVVRGGGETLGVRLPAHEEIRKIIQEVGIPIIAPSANFAGGKTPFSRAEVDKKLITQVDFVLPGECTVKMPSTVIDCSKQPWKILRQGAIKLTLQ